MNVDDLRNYHNAKTDKDLALKLGKNRCVISFWRTKGIPIATQAYMEIKSDGVLKADCIERYNR